MAVKFVEGDLYPEYPSLQPSPPPPTLVEVTALVVRYPGRTVVTAIRNGDEDTHVVYPREHLTLEQVTEVAIMLYKDDEAIGRTIRAYLNGQDLVLDGYAWQLPSIGNVKVSIETKTLIWES